MSYVELCVSGGEIHQKYPIHVDTASHVAGIKVLAKDIFKMLDVSYRRFS